MSNKINVRMILEAKLQGFSNNTIASTRHVSKHSVNEVVKIGTRLGILPAGTIPNLTDDELYRVFFPDRWTYDSTYRLPDYERMHKDLNRTGVTLKQLWSEYCSDCRATGELHVGYTKFCEDYGSYTGMNGFASHLEHKAGDRIEVDWSGPTMRYTDMESERSVTVYLFVSDLVCSRLVYVEPCLDMRMDTWIRCHVNMYSYYGGVSRILVCDNLKTGVTKHPKDGEIILTREYEALAEHYGTGILPADVRAPRQKSSVENSVRNVALKIIARLRDVRFTSFHALKKAVARELELLNDAPFDKRSGSRRTDFEENEKPFLRPLPSSPFECGTWLTGRRCGPNGHVQIDRNWYSVPFNQRTASFDVRLTASEVLIYSDGKLVKRHLRFMPGIKYKYRTDSNDMPKGHDFSEWTCDRIRRWALQFGPSTAEVVDRILQSLPIPEQTFNSALCILRLDKRYDRSRIEKACELALGMTKSPRYSNINAILKSGQDIDSSGKTPGKPESAEFCSRESSFFEKLMGGAHND